MKTWRIILQELCCNTWKCIQRKGNMNSLHIIKTQIYVCKEEFPNVSPDQNGGISLGEWRGKRPCSVCSILVLVWVLSRLGLPWCFFIAIDKYKYKDLSACHSLSQFLSLCAALWSSVCCAFNAFARKTTGLKSPPQLQACVCLSFSGLSVDLIIELEGIKLSWGHDGIEVERARVKYKCCWTGCTALHYAQSESDLTLSTPVQHPCRESKGHPFIRTHMASLCVSVMCFLSLWSHGNSRMNGLFST